MIWFIAGILSPILFAASNVLDQLAMRKYFSGEPVAYRTLIIFPRLLLLPLMLLIPELYDYSILMILFMMSLGVIGFVAIQPYTKALEIEEGAKLIPFLQTIPIFMFVMLYAALGETITALQAFGCGLIIISAFFLLADYKTFRIKKIAFILMMLTAIGLAFSNVLQRIILIQDVSWYVVFLWMSFGKIINAIFIYGYSKKHRILARQFFSFEKYRVWALVFAQQIIANSAYIAYIISIALVPAGVITQSLNGLQPLFVLVIGWLFAIIFPQYFNPPKTKHEWIWYTVFISLMFVGVIMIYNYSGGAA